ncbi:Ku protein [Vulcanibacillus modesticaldus]|uniref:Non-homologous end joining protein Ku n=1 Tax=Vulcanibacillus modesticaldus TaxID=337097 RepID=A0A1D2YTN9_9BACI|nr:Ku protein [Vulcanibacillus modesticaldus]OEF99064.1 Ku protein [Vulcanibacillus modesticaldus]
MHTMWKGSISFGLVNIPIKMYASTEEKDIKFRYLHRECRTPIKYVKTCPTCNREVKPEEIVKGYEFEPGRFVLIEDEDLESLKPNINKSIEILDFVKLSEIDPIYFNKSYYLSPQETGGKAYNLLRQAMIETGKIGIAKITIRSKQSLAVLRVYKNILVLETIFYPDEVRAIDLVPGVSQDISFDQKELEMAKHLIDNLTAKFEPEKYTDDYRQALKELIQRKIEGEEIEVQKEVPKKNIIDLMQALQASIDQTEPPKKTKKGTNRGRKKKTTAS